MNEVYQKSQEGSYEISIKSMIHLILEKFTGKGNVFCWPYSG